MDETAKSTHVAATRAQAEEWSLVLSAQGIPHRVRKTEAGWTLTVSFSDQERVARELAAFQRENPGEEGPRIQETEYGKTIAGFTIAIALLVFHGITGPRESDNLWFTTGSASAERILDGEPWRTITALTLHADAAHVLGNSASAALFVTAVCRTLGPGTGALAILITGALGNGLNAIAHGSHHSSVGASTALFGAIGILAGLQFTRWRRRIRSRPRAWVPIAAGLALLAMLGANENADVGAHFFGFVVGAPLGALAARLGPSALAAPYQLGAGAAFVIAIAMAWSRALGAS